MPWELRVRETTSRLKRAIAQNSPAPAVTKGPQELPAATSFQGTTALPKLLCHQRTRHSTHCSCMAPHCPANRHLHVNENLILSRGLFSKSFRTTNGRNSLIAGQWEIVTANKHEGWVIPPFIASLGEGNTGKEMRLPVLTDFFTELLFLTISHLACCHKCSIE